MSDGCIEAVNEIKMLVSKNIGIASYNETQINQFNALVDQRKKNYDAAHNDWQHRYDNEKNSYASTHVNGDCAGFGVCAQSNCPTGYTDDGTVSGWQANCDYCKDTVFGRICTHTGCAKSCSPNETNVNNHMNDWLQSNPEPQLVPTDSADKKIPITIPVDLHCCKNISNIIGSSVANVKIDQINECAASLQNASSAPDTTNTPTDTATDTATTATKTKTIIIIIILFLLVLFSSSGLLLVVNKQ